MKRAIRLLLVVLLVCAALVISRPRTAQAATTTMSIISVSCTSITVSGVTTETSKVAFGVFTDPQHVISAFPFPTITGPGSYTITLTYRAYSGERLILSNSSFVDMFFTIPPCGGFAGPGIPAGFVLLTITCNTPVFTTAGGNTPSGQDAVTAGQTFFVNPKPVIDAKGKSWTEVFISSYNDPFIPTACLGGAPASGSPAAPTAAPTVAATAAK